MIERPFLRASSTSVEVKRLLFLSMKLDGYARAALAAAAEEGLAASRSSFACEKTVGSRALAFFRLIRL
jgi:hypothetical protein